MDELIPYLNSAIHTMNDSHRLTTDHQDKLVHYYNTKKHRYEPRYRMLYDGLHPSRDLASMSADALKDAINKNIALGHHQ